MRVVRGRLPGSTRGRLLAGGVVLLVLLLAGGIYYYFAKNPNRLADGYRADATRAADRMTDSVTDVFKNFDLYLVESTLPLRELRNANDIDEIRRRFEPVYDETEEVLRNAERAIDRARGQMRKSKATLNNVPGAPLLGGSAPLEEADEVAKEAREYARGASRFLRNYERYVAYDEKALDLRRRLLEPSASENLTADSSLEQFRSAVSSDLSRSKSERADELSLEPHSDAERLHDISMEGATVTVDYFEDLLEGIQTLDIAQLEQADADFLGAVKRLSEQETGALQKFAVSSSLQKTSRKLGEDGEKLEEAIASLGTGDGEPAGDGFGRRPVPRYPDQKDGDGRGDKSVS